MKAHATSLRGRLKGSQETVGSILLLLMVICLQVDHRKNTG
jgi:hypothetical protein